MERGHVPTALLFERPGPSLIPFFRSPKGWSAGRRQGVCETPFGEACEASPHAGPKQVCETCSGARAPARVGIARPDAAALRHPALHHRPGHRPARLSRGALSAPRSLHPPRRVKTAPGEMRRGWEYMLTAYPLSRLCSFLASSPAQAGTIPSGPTMAWWLWVPGLAIARPGRQKPVPNLFLDPPPPCIKQCPCNSRPIKMTP